MKRVCSSKQRLTIDNNTIDGWYCRQETKEIELPSTINSQYILTVQTPSSIPSPQLRRFRSQSLFTADRCRLPRNQLDVCFSLQENAAGTDSITSDSELSALQLQHEERTDKFCTYCSHVMCRNQHAYWTNGPTDYTTKLKLYSTLVEFKGFAQLT